MRELLPHLIAELERGRAAAVATVVSTWSSAPRPPGSALMVTAAGEVTGSISGGCIEADVYHHGLEVLQTWPAVPDDAGTAARTITYGVSDSDAGAIGLTCGGTIEVHIGRVAPSQLPLLRRVAAAVEAGRATGLVLTLSDEGGTGAGTWTEWDPTPTAGIMSPNGATVRRLVIPFLPPDRLLIFGAIDFAAALATAGRFIGYHVTVCDAREVFATAARFPEAHEVVCAWPHEYLQQQRREGRIGPRTAIAVLTHDLKFDLPLLELALGPEGWGDPAERPFYVGAMGSRRTDARRREHLADQGVPPEALARLHGPIGLDLDAATPAETAIAIVAEILAVRAGASARSLSSVNTPIHREPTGQAQLPCDAGRP